MNYLFTIISYIPFILLLVGIPCLILGLFAFRKNRHIGTALLVIGGIAIGGLFAFFLLFFLIGCLGLGPIPT